MGSRGQHHGSRVHGKADQRGPPQCHPAATVDTGYSRIAKASLAAATPLQMMKCRCVQHTYWQLRTLTRIPQCTLRIELTAAVSLCAHMINHEGRCQLQLKRCMALNTRCQALSSVAPSCICRSGLRKPGNCQRVPSHQPGDRKAQAMTLRPESWACVSFGPTGPQRTRGTLSLGRSVIACAFRSPGWCDGSTRWQLPAEAHPL